SLNDTPFSLDLDGAGNIYLAGQATAVPGERDFAIAQYADLLSYTPPANFTGSDIITCTLTDNFGNSSTGIVEVLVVPVAFQFNRSSAALTSGGIQLQLQGVPGSNAVILQASADFISWESILTNAPENGSIRPLSVLNAAFTEPFRR